MAAAFRRSPLPTLALRDAAFVAHANPAAEELLGLGLTSLFGRRIEDLVLGYEPSVLPTGDSEVRLQWEIQRPGRGPARTEAAVSYDAPSRLHIAFLRDLDAEDRTARVIRESEEMFARSFLGAPLALSVSNVETGAFVLVNDQFLALSGYWRSEVIGSTAARLKLWNDPQVRADLAARLEAGEEMPSFQTEFRRKDGSKLPSAGRVRIIEVGGERCVITAALPLG